MKTNEDDSAKRAGMLHCAHCDKRIFKNTHDNSQKAFVRGELKAFSPVFCSEKCADKGESHRNFTHAKLETLLAWTRL